MVRLPNLQCKMNLAKVNFFSNFCKFIFIVLIFLYCDAFIFFILGLYLEEVLPHQYGISRHPLFFIQDFLPKKKKKNDDLRSINNFVQSYDEFSPLITSISSPGNHIIYFFI